MMNWKLILAVAPIGLVMGILKVLGATTPLTEVLLWTTCCVLTGFIVAKRRLNNWLTTCLVIGLVWGTLHNAVESIFFNEYLENNEGYAESMSNPKYIPARYFVLLTGPIAGLATGCLTVLFSCLTNKFLLNR